MAHLNTQNNFSNTKKRRKINQKNNVPTKAPQRHQRIEKLQEKKSKGKIIRITLSLIFLIAVFATGILFVMNKQENAKMEHGIKNQVVGADAEQIKAQKAINTFDKVLNKYCTDDSASNIKNYNINNSQYRVAKKELSESYDNLPKDYQPNFANIESRAITMMKVQLAYNNCFSDKKKAKIKNNISPADVLNQNTEINSDLNTLIDETSQSNPFVQNAIKEFTQLGNDAQKIVSAYNAVDNDMQLTANLQADPVAQNLYNQIVNGKDDSMTSDQIKDMVNSDLQGQNKDVYASVYSNLNSPKDFEIAHCYLVKNDVSYSKIKDDGSIKNLNFSWSKQTKFIKAIVSNKAIKEECSYYSKQAQKKVQADSAKQSSEKANSEKDAEQQYQEQREKALQNAYSQMNKQMQQQQQNAQQQAQQQNQNNNQQQQSSSQQQNNNQQNNNQNDNDNNNQQQADDTINQADNDPNIHDKVLQGAVTN